MSDNIEGEALFTEPRKQAIGMFTRHPLGSQTSGMGCTAFAKVDAVGAIGAIGSGIELGAVA
jgi:hypothetical protein